ncbi:hypothetical protein [Actinomadura sp. NPDC048394]|uniref:hypothetical protein n=1 Tax=Actinomadura sp. NPDC048394 TaxID=3158223 RepID=UPI0033D35139
MTTQHSPAALGSAATGRDRDPQAWVAPLLATVLVLLLGPAALILGGLSAMATDACGPDDCPPALMRHLDLIYGILEFGWPVVLAAIATAWLLPWRRRWSAARACSALASLMPPLLVLVLVFTLPAS